MGRKKACSAVEMSLDLRRLLNCLDVVTEVWPGVARKRIRDRCVQDVRARHETWGGELASCAMPHRHRHNRTPKTPTISR